MRGHHRTIAAWLEAQGATSIRLDTTHKHPRVLFLFAGQQWSYVTSGTPSDTNAVFAAVRDIKAMLGLRRTIKVTRSRRVRRQIVRTDHAALPATITPGRDWSEPLNHHSLYPAVLSLRLDQAWRRWWRALAADTGFASRV